MQNFGQSRIYRTMPRTRNTERTRKKGLEKYRTIGRTRNTELWLGQEKKQNYGELSTENRKHL